MNSKIFWGLVIVILSLLQFIPEEILKNILLVSESGLLSKDDFKYAENLNVDALLIGEALMKGLIF